jgi:hypothetical protein
MTFFLARPQSPDPEALLARLHEAEGVMRSRSARIGARLELAASAMLLLQLASHADAALEDLTSFAEVTGVSLFRGWGWIRVWVRAAFDWIAELLSIGTVTDRYRMVVAAARRDIELASALRSASLAAGDVRTATWCALWIEQRSSLADGLEASLSEPALVAAGVLAESMAP